MSSDYEKSRYNQRSKKRKTNLILNSLIGVVLLLIVVVSATIFLGGNDEQAATEVPNKAEKQETADQEEKEQEEQKSDGQEEEVEEDPVLDEKPDEDLAENETEEDQADGQEEELDPEDTSGQVVKQGGSSPEVIRTIINPDWKPVGTVQEGEHVNVYDGVDWDEMVRAISYATGIEKDNMTIYFLGNNGHNKSVGTVYPKNKEVIYRVYIEWVDNQGWKPTMVEELSEIVQ
ncbi:YrrS family protein [Bacillus dakarensis]|uniref:YrrS family protein n=1 Tax=Robertmurraya dakarensis TaxID=1926278 RepID=UPI0009811075|nr:YrrS family protein [Bacillus dakarensis]